MPCERGRERASEWLEMQKSLYTRLPNAPFFNTPRAQFFSFVRWVCWTLNYCSFGWQFSKWHFALCTLLFGRVRAKIYLLCFLRHFSNGRASAMVWLVCDYCILLSFVIFISFDLWDDDDLLSLLSGRLVGSVSGRGWSAVVRKRHCAPCSAVKEEKQLMLHRKTHYIATETYMLASIDIY